MRNYTKLAMIAAGLVITFTACKKNNPPGGEPFSPLTVEENKQYVENSALEVSASMQKINDLESLDAAVSLGNLLDMADPVESKTAKKSKITGTIKVIAGLKTGENEVFDVFRVMRAPGELEEDPETLQELWDEIAGIYMWNPETEDWDYEENSTKIEFQFPSTEDGIVNDAILTIDNFTSVTIATPLEEEYEGDIPTSLNMKLVIGSTEVVAYTFTAQYNSDGVPAMVASDLRIETFTFSVDMTNSDTEISAGYIIRDGDKTLMELSGAVNGDFSKENIEANTFEDTYTWTDYVYNEETGNYDPVEVTETETEYRAENIFRSANAKFQVVNVALKGEVDIQALVQAENEIYPEDYYEDPNFDEKAAAEAEAEAFNKYANLSAIDVVNNEILAKCEAYVVEEGEEGYMDYWVDVRLIFGDGSLIDLETYFDEGFEDFVDEINGLIADLNTEYGWDLELIDY